MKVITTWGTDDRGMNANQKKEKLGLTDVKGNNAGLLNLRDAGGVI